MTRRTRAAVVLPPWPTCPPLTSVTTLSSLVITPPWNYRLTEPSGDKRASFEKYIIAKLPDDLESRAFGNLQDLIDVHHNVAFGSNLLETMLRDCIGVCAQRGVDAPIRALVSAKLLALGVSMVTSAHTICMKEELFFHSSALVLMRTAIELVGRGGWVALGTGNEPHRVVSGPKLPTREERRAAEVPAGTCLDAIAPEAQSKWREADHPRRVYEWLCRFTHFDAIAVERLNTAGVAMQEDAYAASAYVAWLGAAMAEVVIGQRGAVQPRLPNPRPWQ